MPALPTLARLALLALLLLTGCAARTHSQGYLADSATPSRAISAPRTSSPRSVGRRAELEPIQSSQVDVDYFQGLLVRGGVPPHALPKDGRQLTPEDAARLLSWLLAANVPLRDFGPWRMAAYLLVEVEQGGVPISRKELHSRMRRFQPLLVLRPDGYLVWATTGRAVQHVGKVQWAHGALHAEGFQVGPFYKVQGRFLYPAEARLDIHPDAELAGVYEPEDDILGPMVEGAGLAVVDSVSGLVTLVLHPIDSLSGLAQLPEAVRTLIENSPQYWEHFRAMSPGGQTRAVSRLVTNILITCGTSGAGGARAFSAGNSLGHLGVPVLSLSAEGALSLRMVAVPAGQLVTAVGTGASAVYILHMANLGSRTGPPPQSGPGQWVRKTEAMSEEASRYQVQVARTTPGWVYRVFFGPGPKDSVDFDGFLNGVLLEAKGPNLAKFITEALEPLPFFQGADGLLRQAQRQLGSANGLPVRWIVAEKRFADYLRKLFDDNGLQSIEILHVPMKP